MGSFDCSRTQGRACRGRDFRCLGRGPRRRAAVEHSRQLVPLHFFGEIGEGAQPGLAVLAALLVFSGIAWAAAGPRGLLTVFAVLLITALFALFCRQKIGGVTGDTLGAACELAEATVALVFVLQLGGGI